MKKLLLAAVVFGFSVFTFAADAAIKIGVAMPTKSLQRWNQDGENIKNNLEAAGYKVDLQYGGNYEIPVQVSQIENMIANKCQILVIAPIDGSALTEVLKDAKSNNIAVIAYDRLIMNSDAVNYYASFDNYICGVVEGNFIKDKLNLDQAAGPFNIEIFAGAADDSNSGFYYEGALSVLQPYFKSGKLVVPSKQTTKAQCAIRNWSPEEAQKRMENLVTAQNYGPKGKRLDAVLSPNDSIAVGISTALVEAGYTANDFPILTGMDCDRPSVKNIIAGTQSMSIFKDTRTLAGKVVGMVDAIAKGSKPEINNTTDYNNGLGAVPSYLCEVIVVTKDNVKKVVVDDAHYYTAAELDLDAR